MKRSILSAFFIFLFSSFAAEPTVQIALLKYAGGGDWYANLETSLPNLIKFCNENIKTNIITPSDAPIKATGWFNMATVTSYSIKI